MSARRLGLLALVVGMATALVLSHPLALHPASTILDDGTLDCFQFTWNLWWVRTALLDLHTNPFFTHYLFYPQGVSLLFHTLSASLGFMMPSGTAPNAIVFSTGHLTVGYMARVGFALNLLSVVVVTAATFLLARPVFGISLVALPPWAHP